MDNQQPFRWHLSENQQSLLGALLVMALLPIIFGMLPLRGLLVALLPAAWHPALGLGAADQAAWQTAMVNFQPFAQAATWRFLALGLLMTVGVSAVAIVLSLPLATLAALARLSGPPWLRWPTVAGVEVVRAFPVLILIFYVFTRFSRLSDELNQPWLRTNNVTISVIIALTLYTTVVNAETLRAAILSLDVGQTEAARSLGLTYWQAMWLVILPQAFRRGLPPLIAQFVTLVKDTSLGAIVGLLEIYRRAQILYQFNRNPMETFFVVAVVYFVLNYALGQAAQALERRVTGSRQAGSRLEPGAGA